MVLKTNAERIVQLGNAIVRERSRRALEFGLTSTQVAVMSFLLHNRDREEINLLDVQNDQMLTHQTVAGILQRLENKGFIRCVRSRKDKRSKSITVTPKGMDLNAFLRTAATECEARLVDGMSAEDQQELGRLLQVVQTNLGK